MKETVVALLNQDGSIDYINLKYQNDIYLNNINQIIKNKGINLEVIEEGNIFNKNFVIVGYKSGNKFNKHDINNGNVKGDAVFITLHNEEYIDTTEADIKQYFHFYDLENSSEDEELGVNDSYDFSDGFLINDL